MLLFTIHYSLFTASLWAGHLWSSVGEVRLKNLNIGQTYKLTELAGFAMSAQNSSDYPLHINMRVEVPPPEQCKKGFEPLPDASWIKLGRDTFQSVAPRVGVASTDVLITIPNDKKLKKRAFQFQIASSGSSPGSNIGMEILSRFLIILGEKEGVVPYDPTASYAFELSPFDTFLGKIELGKVYDLSEMGKRLTLKNPTKKPWRYRFTTLDAYGAQATPPKRFPDIPGTKFLSYDEDTIAVEPGQKKDVKMYLWIPKDKKYENKNFMFVVKAETADAPISFSVFARVYVSTGKIK